jgi:hypothetical protein
MTNVWVLLDWIGRIGASLMFIDKGIGHLGNRVVPLLLTMHPYNSEFSPGVQKLIPSVPASCTIRLMK